MLRRYRRYILKKPGKKLDAILKPLSKIHPFIGVTLMITGFLHGYMALGSIRLHTGYLTWFLVLVLFAIRIWGSLSKDRYWLVLHRAIALLLVVSLLLHIFAGNLI
ncbi:MAG TPA: hypothetical protein GXZ37_08130 [Clostridiales bacterium]|nr:hypothetical protein [Clostridiales bacterium]